MISISTLVTAFLLDLLFGDPKWLPHPVRWMGWFIKRYEASFRNAPVPLWISGIGLAVLLPWLAYWLTWFVIWMANSIHHEWAWMAEVFLIYQCISIRGLYDETKPVYQSLRRKDMFHARQSLSLVVGRDTHKLDEPEISRAAVETVAEGTVDGIVSPLVFAAIGGAPLAMAFKAVSTLDSMIGYKNERYKQFGWASARLDDVCNFIPARLSILIIPLAAVFGKLNGNKSWQVGWKERLKHNSPNAGHAEAAFAGALDIRLGGTSTYQGVISHKAVLHEQGKQAQPDDIPKAWKLMFISSVLFVGMTVFIIFIFSSFLVDKIGYVLLLSSPHERCVVQCLLSEALKMGSRCESGAVPPL